MKFSIVLYFASIALAANSYHLIKRGIPSRVGLSSGKGVSSSMQANLRAAPLRRITTKASFDNGKVPFRASESQSKDHSVSVEAKGPAELRFIDKQGNTKSHFVDKGDSATKSSSDTRRVEASGLVKGTPTGETDLKIKAKGRYAGLILETGAEGSAHFKSTGDGASNEDKLGPKEKIQTLAHIPKGGATVEATVSRPGSASVIAFKSAADIPEDEGPQINTPP